MYSKVTATKKILNLRKRIRGVAGGTSASKTISIIMWCIDYALALKKSVTISIVSESMPHLKRGAIRDFLNIMQEHGYFNDSKWNKTDFIYDFTELDKDGNTIKKVIEFFSADQPGKVRGPRRDVLFINEANNISYETYTQLEIRTKDIVWLDWNPVSEFWWYSEIMGKQDVDFITLTYKDNEALDPKVVAAIEVRKGNKNWWRVYGEGLLGEAEGRIFKDWATQDEIPHEARLERYGVDLGYTNDPTAIIGIYHYNGGYILDEVAYLKGLSNKQIADILLNQPKALVICDSAEPKSIDEIKSYGINILPSQKGQGSVLQGIQYVQDQRVSITKHSLNLLKEYRNYLWMTDRDGIIINEPSPIFNHAMDALRYGMESLKPSQPIDWNNLPKYEPSDKTIGI
jgi:phage terminase large subunit